MTKKRPKHLNLLQIRQPLPAIVSILHRVSGVVLLVMLAVILWLLDRSLRSPESFQQFAAVMSSPLTKLVVLGLLWAYFHHLCAGVRHLAFDLHFGTTLAAARASSVAVVVVSVALTIIAAVMLW